MTQSNGKQASPDGGGLITRQILGWCLAVLLVLMLAYIALGESGRMERAEEQQAAAAIESGAALYELHCKTCHGANGEGIGQLGPALSDKKFFSERLAEVAWQDTLDSYIYSTMAHGRQIATRSMYAGNAMTAVMAPWLKEYGGPLRPDELRNLTAFLLNWKDTALGKVELVKLELPKVSLSDPQTIGRGKKVFTAHCASCHSIAGLNQARKKGPDLSQAAQLSAKRKPDMDPEAYLRESFLVPAEFVVPGFEASKLGYSCGGTLSVRELDDVIGFLLSQK